MKDVASLPVNDVLAAFDSKPEGLSSEEAKKRLTKYGPNTLIERRPKSLVYRFVVHLKDLFGILLLFASALAAISGSWQLSLIILAVVVVNIVFSIFQEWRAEKAMETLKRWMPEYAKAFRDSELKKVLVSELVPGDIIVVEEGDRVPADARLLEVYDLWTNNVPLTGESEPQPRTTTQSEVADTTYLDVPNLVFMSTSVARGRGEAVVINTGMNTRFGQIAGLTQQIHEDPSPLQKEIAYTARYDFILAVTVGIVFFLLTFLWLKSSFLTSILFMIGVMVACVPEGLQVTVSSALAINVLKMVKENVLVKRLSAVQTLGSVTVICTDKTGTITTGEMTVEKIWTFDRTINVTGAGYTPTGEFIYEGKPLEREKSGNVEKLLEISAVCNSSKIEPPSDRNRSWTVVGDPTDGALLVSALKYGLNIQNILVEKPIVHVIPFDSNRKRMTTILKNGTRYLVYSKGAPRSILSMCNRLAVNGKVESFTKESLRTVENRIRELGEQGLRMMAIAYNEAADFDMTLTESIEDAMVFVGLAAMRDPPRPEVAKAVSMAKQAGIRTVIITGDYGPTALAIAEDVGIVRPEICRIIRGVDLETMIDEAIVEEIKKGDIIFARVSPEQKLRIVTVIKHHGEVVAVTGDGANDAPSLKEADIGVAMGVSGTDVAREAADLILLDDSFASIVKAVESGRTIYDNIRKFIVYVFAHNWAELIPYVLYAVLGIPLPLLVVQVLAIDLGIDVIPSLALSREPSEAGIMFEPPRSVKERLFNRGVFSRSLFIGIIIAVGAMYGCFNAWMAGGWRLGMHFASDIDPVYMKGTTMTFAGIVVAQVGNVLATRSAKQSIFRVDPRSNKWIWIGIACQLGVLSAMIYVPPLQVLFGTTAIGWGEWAFLGALAFIVLFIEETRKLFARRFAK